MSTPNLLRNQGGGGFSAVGQPSNASASPTTTYNQKAIISAASVNAQNLSAIPGRIGTIHLVNTAASEAYLKLYDKATTPVPGTDTPIAVYAIPKSAGGGILHVPGLDSSVNFTLGIGIAITLNAALNDNTVLGGANTVVGTITY